MTLDIEKIKAIALDVFAPSVPNATVIELINRLEAAESELNVCSIEYGDVRDSYLHYKEKYEAAEKDAARYHWLNATLHSAKGGASVCVNDEFAYYEIPEEGKEVRIQWYPDTPIGFYLSEAKTLSEAIDAAMKESEK